MSCSMSITRSVRVRDSSARDSTSMPHGIEKPLTGTATVPGRWVVALRQEPDAPAASFGDHRPERLQSFVRLIDTRRERATFEHREQLVVEAGLKGAAREEKGNVGELVECDRLATGERAVAGDERAVHDVVEQTLPPKTAFIEGDRRDAWQSPRSTRAARSSAGCLGVWNSSTNTSRAGIRPRTVAATR